MDEKKQDEKWKDLPFKVDARKGALERFYGRELSGQEVETAQRILEDKMADAYGKKRWDRLTWDKFIQRKPHEYEWFAVLDSFSVVQATDGETIDTERPLSDFLPAPSETKVAPSIRVLPYQCVECLDVFKLMDGICENHVGSPCPKADCSGKLDCAFPTENREQKPNRPKWVSTTEIEKEIHGPAVSSSDLCCAECRHFDISNGPEPTCPLRHDLPDGTDMRVFYCADFESHHTGMGVRETIRQQLAAVAIAESELAIAAKNAAETSAEFLDRADPDYGKHQETPNCAKCQWYQSPYICKACGHDDSRKRFGTNGCRALYVPKPVGGWK